MYLASGDTDYIRANQTDPTNFVPLFTGSINEVAFYASRKCEICPIDCRSEFFHPRCGLQSLHASSPADLIRVPHSFLRENLQTEVRHRLIMMEPTSGTPTQSPTPNQSPIGSFLTTNTNTNPNSTGYPGAAPSFAQWQQTLSSPNTPVGNGNNRGNVVTAKMSMLLPVATSQQTLPTATVPMSVPSVVMNMSSNKAVATGSLEDLANSRSDIAAMNGTTAPIPIPVTPNPVMSTSCQNGSPLMPLSSPCPVPACSPAGNNSSFNDSDLQNSNSINPFMTYHQGQGNVGNGNNNSQKDFHRVNLQCIIYALLSDILTCLNSCLEVNGDYLDARKIADASYRLRNVSILLLH